MNIRVTNKYIDKGKGYKTKKIEENIFKKFALSFIQTLRSSTITYYLSGFLLLAQPLPYNFILHLYLITLPYNNLTNLTKSYHLSEP